MRRYGLVALLCILAYANSIGGAFTNWDDDILVERNEAIRSLAPANVWRMFSDPIGETYQPLRLLSYAIDYALWELKPVGYHVVNILLHAGAAVLLLLLLERLLEGWPKLKHSREIALVAALLFALHPVNVESVAWISSRKYGLVACFGFCSLWLYLRSSQVKDWRYGVSLLAALAACLSSPFGVVIPALMLWVDLCKHGPDRTRWPRYVGPILAFAILAGVLGSVLIGGGDGGDRAVRGREALTVATMSSAHSMGAYARNLVLPLWLNNKYADNPTRSLADPLALLGILLVVGTVVFALRRWREGDRLPALCAGWFVIGIAPVSGLLVPINARMADRYLYLPGVAVFLGLAVAVYALLDQKRARVVLGVALGLLFVGTVARNLVWKDSLSLWRDSVAKDGQNPLPRANLAHALMLDGQLTEALEEARRAEQLNPDLTATLSTLGKVLIDLEQNNEAATALLRLRELGDAHVLDLSNLGAALIRAQRPAEAVVVLEEALKMDPDVPEVGINLAQAFAQTGDYAKAELYFPPALAAVPDDPNVCYEYAMMKVRMGDVPAGKKWLEEALRRDPAHARSHNNLATAYFTQGRKSEAIHHYREAVKHDPTYALPWHALGVIALQDGKVDDAVVSLRQALAAIPGYVEAHYHLGTALMNQNKFTEAATHLQRVPKTAPQYADSQRKLAICQQQGN
ncbi:MAG: tetratricopeptide (TPR) repeat protein [Rhodothermales bacterium]|jgi:tetratricopeptide (TPR) repeat protein